VGQAHGASGAGELLLTSMDRDGTGEGFDIALTRAIVRRRDRAGDRLGRRRHARPSRDGVKDGHASAVLAASIFHFGKFSIAEAKAHLKRSGIPVRDPMPLA
jgi:cyclase